MQERPSSFACVRCRGELLRQPRSLVCSACGETYRTIAGGLPLLLPPERIPQFVPDPGMEFNAAVDLAEELAAQPGSFRDLVNYYYEKFRHQVEPALFEYYRNIVANRDVVDVSDEICAASLGLNLLPATFPRVRVAAEIGCGWGFSLATLSKGYRDNPYLSGARLLGMDINPAILVIAQRLFRDLQLDDIELAVANAEFPLPLRPGSVDFLFASCVVEHLPAQRDAMESMSEALSPDSLLYFSVPNRYTLHPEPHFNRRWVGFVPRRWQKKYVGWRMGIPPEQVDTIWSYTPRDLARLLCPSFPRDQIAVVPVDVKLGTRVERAIRKLFPSLGVGSHQCVVRRTPADSTNDRRQGVLHLGSIHLRQPPRIVRTLHAADSSARSSRETWHDYARATTGATVRACAGTYAGQTDISAALAPAGIRVASSQPAVRQDAGDDESWFLLDLGRPRKISSVEIAWTSAEAVPQQFQLECGEPDNFILCLDECQADRWTQGNVYRRLLPRDASARYFRFRGAARDGSPIVRFSLLSRGPAPKNILMLAPDCYGIDRRILQEARTLLKQDHRVTLLCGFECPNEDSFIEDGIEIHRYRFDWDDERLRKVRARFRSPFIHRALNSVFRRFVRPLLRVTSYEVFMRAKAEAFPADAIHVHDLPCLHAGVWLAKKRNIPVIFDAHEIYWEQEILPAKLRSALCRLEQRLMPQVDELIVTNPASQVFHQSRYGREAHVLMNCCESLPAGAATNDCPPLEALKRQGKRIAMYQGVLAPERNLAVLARSVAHLPEDVVLAFVGGGEHEAELRSIVRQAGREGSVVFTGMVPSSQMRNYTVSADVGLIPYLPIDANHRLCSPNKFFEFVREGLPILYHQELEFLGMMDRQHGVCLPVDMRDPRAVAAAIVELLDNPPRLAALRNACQKAAQSLNWESQEQVLLGIYRRNLRKAA